MQFHTTILFLITLVSISLAVSDSEAVLNSGTNLGGIIGGSVGAGIVILFLVIYCIMRSNEEESDRKHAQPKSEV
jgi:uncharacterized Tic20 family protein